MKLVAYLRVSTIEQADKGYGLDVQREAIRKAAKSLDAKIVTWSVDEGKSGALDAAKRPGLLDALTIVRDGKANGLIVRDLDRLARAVSVQEAVLAEVWGKESCAVFTSVPPQEVPRDDPDDPMRTAMRQMRGVFHELIADSSLSGSVTAEMPRLRRAGTPQARPHTVGGSTSRTPRTRTAHWWPNPPSKRPWLG